MDLFATSFRRLARPLRRLAHPLTAAALAVTGVVVAACADDAPLTPDQEPILETARARAPGASAHAPAAHAAEAPRGLAELRRATARYHDVDAAVADGFEQLLPCLEDPSSGGLGIPYGNLERFDTEIDLGEPEVLFYEPQEDGRLRLVGAEPVVPIALWPEEDPPSLFGVEFHTNEDHGLYGLHMWVWRHNPDGVFSFWNPAVSCEFAE